MAMFHNTCLLERHCRPFNASRNDVYWAAAGGNTVAISNTNANFFFDAVSHSANLLQLASVPAYIKATPPLD